MKLFVVSFTGDARPGCARSSKVQGEVSSAVHLRAIRSIRSLMAAERSEALLYMYRLGCENEFGTTPSRVDLAVDEEDRAFKWELKVGTIEPSDNNDWLLELESCDFCVDEEFPLLRKFSLFSKFSRSCVEL